jgi:glycosyltransferase involved in cell wall biosynthesis
MAQAVKVSVLMAVYNGVEHLTEAVNSILEQSLADFEFLIIDDGSTDNSWELLQSFKDQRIVLARNDSNLGLIKTLNRGLDMARGEYIVRMDHDDISSPNRLERQVAFMDSHPDCSVCGSWIRTFGAVRPRVVKYETDPNVIVAQLLFTNPLAHPTVILRRELMVKFGWHYDEAYPHVEDYELWSRISRQAKICNIPEVLLHYRISPGQITRHYSSEQNRLAGSIRVRNLDIFSADFTPAELSIQRILGASDSPATLDFIDRSAAWLERVKQVNSSQLVYNSAALRKAASLAYYDLLVKNINLGFPVWHRLWLYPNLGLARKIRFAGSYLKRRMIPSRS